MQAAARRNGHSADVRSRRSETDFDFADKPEECFDKLSTNGKISNDFRQSSVRPEALEG
jgi:hypothetical protein